MNNYLTAVDKLLEQEGGYVNDHNDSGGETNYGICKRDNPNIDIKGLTRESAEQYYLEHYWTKYGFDKIANDQIASYWFNHAVNCGIGPITKIVQTVIQDIMQQSNIFHKSITVDGVPGPETIALLNEYWKPEKLLNVKEKLWGHYERIMEANPNDEKYRQGWWTRCYS